MLALLPIVFQASMSQSASKTKIGGDEVLNLLLRSAASRPAKGAAVARVGTMLRASASHCECVGIRSVKVGSGCLEYFRWLIQLDQRLVSLVLEVAILITLRYLDV